MQLRIGQRFLPLPGPLWRWAVRREATAARERFDRLPGDHKRVRQLAVTELVRTGAALRPALLADQLELPAARVVDIVASLEREKIYMFRSDGAAVSWAYPATVDDTAHHLRFESGERINAA